MSEPSEAGNEEKSPPTAMPGATSDTGPDWLAADSALHDYGNRLVAAYLGSSYRSDIAFHVEAENVRIPAHSLIVAAASPVLQRCCFGTGDCVSPVQVIAVPNCTVATFWVVLRHLYKDADKLIKADVSEEKVLDALATNIGLTIDNAAAVLCLADYYDLRQLVSYCSRLLLRGLGHSNVCSIFERIHMLDDQVVAKRCTTMIFFVGSELLGSVMAMECEMAIAKVLRADNFQVRDEYELFHEMCEWADQKCSSNGSGSSSISAAGRRKQMQDRLQHVRFGIMTSAQFAQCVRRAGVGFFSANEIATVVQQIAMGDQLVVPSPFERNDKSKKRKCSPKAVAKLDSSTSTDSKDPPVPYWFTARTKLLPLQICIATYPIQRNAHITSHNLVISPIDQSAESYLTGLTVTDSSFQLQIRNVDNGTVIQTSLSGSTLTFNQRLALNGSRRWNLNLTNNDCNQNYYKMTSKLQNATNLSIFAPGIGTTVFVSAVHVITLKLT